MQVVYLDSVFVLNTVTDYLLLTLTARLAGISLRRCRYVMIGAFGGGYAALCFLPGLCFLAATPVKIAVGILMALAAFGNEERLVRLTLLFFFISCGFAGGVMALGLLLGGVPILRGILFTDINTKTIAASFSAGYVLVNFVFRTSAKHWVSGDIIKVKVRHRKSVSEFTALLDNGNTLCDPSSGRPVLVATSQSIGKILPDRLRSLIGERNLRNPADLLEPVLAEDPSLQPGLLPYRVVGNAAGLLFTICPEEVEIEGEIYPKLRVALSPTSLGDGYSALWGGRMEKGGKA